MKLVSLMENRSNTPDSTEMEVESTKARHSQKKRRVIMQDSSDDEPVEQNQGTKNIFNFRS